MRIEGLKLFRFRNYSRMELNLDMNLNLFVGENAQGKTNLLEAIAFLATGKSFRSRNDSDLVQWGETSCQVSATVDSRQGRQTLQITSDLALNKKTYSCGGVSADRKSYLGHLVPILFTPEDLSLVKGSPQGRRRFFDEEISKIYPLYEYELVRYQQIVRQRNFLLKRYREKSLDMQEMESWNEQLVSQAVKVLTKRLTAIHRIGLLARLTHRNLTGRDESLEISYCPSAELPVSGDTNQMGEALRQRIQEKKREEARVGQTLVGPHRDDIMFSINGKNARLYASQGQQRTLVLALKLAELEYVKGETGEYPVLLFDDVFSELDERRRRLLVETIDGRVQTFITGTEAEKLGTFRHAGKLLTVSRGEVH